MKVDAYNFSNLYTEEEKKIFYEKYYHALEHAQTEGEKKEIHEKMTKFLDTLAMRFVNHYHLYKKEGE